MTLSPVLPRVDDGFAAIMFPESCCLQAAGLRLQLALVEAKPSTKVDDLDARLQASQLCFCSVSFPCFCRFPSGTNTTWSQVLVATSAIKLRQRLAGMPAACC